MATFVTKGQEDRGFWHILFILSGVLFPLPLPIHNFYKYTSPNLPFQELGNMCKTFTNHGYLHQIENSFTVYNSAYQDFYGLQSKAVSIWCWSRKVGNNKDVEYNSSHCQFSFL